MTETRSDEPSLDITETVPKSMEVSERFLMTAPNTLHKLHECHPRPNCVVILKSKICRACGSSPTSRTIRPSRACGSALALRDSWRPPNSARVPMHMQHLTASMNLYSHQQ